MKSYLMTIPQELLLQICLEAFDYSEMVINIYRDGELMDIGNGPKGKEDKKCQKMRIYI